MHKIILIRKISLIIIIYLYENKLKHKQSTKMVQKKSTIQYIQLFEYNAVRIRIRMNAKFELFYSTRYWGIYQYIHHYQSLYSQLYILLLYILLYMLLYIPIPISNFTLICRQGHGFIDDILLLHGMLLERPSGSSSRCWSTNISIQI